MKIKKGDNVVVLTGKDRGKQAKVLRALPRFGKLIVEGVNLQKRRERARRQGQKGQVLETAAPIDISNVALWCSHCGRGVRVGYKTTARSKTRVCRRCGQEL